MPSVADHIPGTTFSSSTSPTLAAVTRWLEQAEAILEGVAESAGQEVDSFTDGTPGQVQLGRAAVTYALAQLYLMRSGIEGDEDNRHGESYVARWESELARIRAGISGWRSELGHGDGAVAQTARGATITRAFTRSGGLI